jgi:hypothetical protein
MHVKVSSRDLQCFKWWLGSFPPHGIFPYTFSSQYISISSSGDANSFSQLVKFLKMNFCFATLNSKFCVHGIGLNIACNYVVLKLLLHIRNRQVKICGSILPNKLTTLLSPYFRRVVLVLLFAWPNLYGDQMLMGGDTLLQPNEISTTLKNNSISPNTYLVSGLYIGCDLHNKGR